MQWRAVRWQRHKRFTKIFTLSNKIFISTTLNQPSLTPGIKYWRNICQSKILHVALNCLKQFAGLQFLLWLCNQRKGGQTDMDGLAAEGPQPSCMGNDFFYCIYCNNLTIILYRKCWGAIYKLMNCVLKVSKVIQKIVSPPKKQCYC